MKIRPQRLSPELLDKVWNEWLVANKPTMYEQYTYLGRPYKVARHRRINKSEKFESWLFREYGATVRQVSGKLHLEFTQPERASFFILRHL